MILAYFLFLFFSMPLYATFRGGEAFDSKTSTCSYGDARDAGVADLCAADRGK